MERWTVRYLREVAEDMARLDGNVRLRVRKAIKKLETAPESFGKPLGRKRDRNLTGLREAKLRDNGIRIIYEVRRMEGELLIVVVGVRKDEEVYRVAEKRIRRSK